MGSFWGPPPRRSRRPAITQNSRLLDLPAELRSQIYEYAAKNTESVYIRRNALLYFPPLNLVCSQIRAEYRNVYRDRGLYCTTTAYVLMTDFDWLGHANSPSLRAPQNAPLLEQLSRTSFTEKHVVIRMTLTNTFDTYLHDLRHFFTRGCSFADYEIELYWKAKTFEVDYLRQHLSKLQWCLNVGNGNATRDGFSEKLWVAFEEAVKRYEVTRAGGGVVGKKRKRQLGG